jgi:ribose 5-phosphate isomerase
LPRKIVIDKSGDNTTGIKAINKLLKGFGCPIPIEIVRRKYSTLTRKRVADSSRDTRNLCCGSRPYLKQRQRSMD